MAVAACIIAGCTDRQRLVFSDFMDTYAIFGFKKPWKRKRRFSRKGPEEARDRC